MRTGYRYQEIDTGLHVEHATVLTWCSWLKYCHGPVFGLDVSIVTVGQYKSLCPSPRHELINDGDCHCYSTIYRRCIGGCRNSLTLSGVDTVSRLVYGHRGAVLSFGAKKSRNVRSKKADPPLSFSAAWVLYGTPVLTPHRK